MKLHKTIGIVTDVSKMWWIKIKLKAVRVSPTDGAAFPHKAAVKYSVDGREYTAKVYIPWRLIPPEVGAQVAVMYAEDRPRLSFIDCFGGAEK